MKKWRTVSFLMSFLVLTTTTACGILNYLCINWLYSMGIFSNIFTAAKFFPVIPIFVSIVIGTILSIIIDIIALKPLKELIKALQIIAKGDFSVRVKKLKQRGELSELMLNFNVMAEELGSIEIFRQNFINNFSHEFKTPIVSIRGFAKQLQKSTLTEQQRKEYTDIIISEAERLTNMSSNILLLTKFENQQIINDKREFYLDEQIRKCVLLLEKQWSKKNINFNLDLNEVLYHTNEEMLSNVWINLLSNAIKFSEDNSEINIECYKRGHVIIVEITDHGIGIDAETIKHIFDKFYQGDTSHAKEGNGLGLALVKRIIMLCEGEISVTSEIGNGTTFKLLLPIKE